MLVILEKHIAETGSPNSENIKLSVNKIYHDKTTAKMLLAIINGKEYKLPKKFFKEKIHGQSRV